MKISESTLSPEGPCILRSRRLRAIRAYTLIEMMMAVGVLAIGAASLYYAFSMANVTAVSSRNRLSSQDLGRSLLDMVQEGGAYETATSKRGNNTLLVRSPADAAVAVVPNRQFYSYNNTTRQRYSNASLVGRVGITGGTSPEFISQPAGSQSPLFGGAAANTSYMRFPNLPLYVPVDMGRSAVSLPVAGGADPMVTGNVVRLVEGMNAPIRIGPNAADVSDETDAENALRIRMVNFDVTYTYQGKEYTSTFRTFRAPD